MPATVRRHCQTPLSDAGREAWGRPAQSLQKEPIPSTPWTSGLQKANWGERPFLLS